MTQSLTTEEAARVVGVSRQAVYQWIRRGFVPPRQIRLGRSTFYLWSPEDVKRLRRFRRNRS